MKKILLLILALLMIGTAVAEENSPSVNGQLSVSGSQLVDASGDPVALRGLSTHGIAWFPQYINEECFRELKEGFGIDLIRIAMYTGENGGYCEDGDQAQLKELVRKGVRLAQENDMYVIIDWHILSDNDPRAHQDEAIAFFDEMSAEYADSPNVLYEICNEPNSGTSWEDIREYALEVIPVIRANSPEAVIIVGTPDWSSRIDLAAEDPITEYENIMYAMHFYSASNRQNMRDILSETVAAGLPVFVTEYGICSADGDGTYAVDQANAWMDLMDELSVSSAMWNISNKAELSAIFKPDFSADSGFTSADLTTAGLWLAHRLHGSLEVDFDGMDDLPAAAADGTNLCSDPGGWGSWIDRGAGADADVVYSDGVVTADVRASGKSNWFVQPSYSGLTLEAGKTYELNCTISASCDIKADIQVQQNYSPYGAYMALVDQNVGVEPMTVTTTFTMNADTDKNVSLVFNVGANECEPYTVTIENVSITAVE